MGDLSFLTMYLFIQALFVLVCTHGYFIFFVLCIIISLFVLAIRSSLSSFQLALLSPHFLHSCRKVMSYVYNAVRS
jgi:hypothetical protein